MPTIKRLGYRICIVIVTSLTLIGCNIKAKNRIEVIQDGKKIVLLKNEPDKEPLKASEDGFIVEKINKYQGYRSEDWIDDDTILTTKLTENKDKKSYGSTKTRKLYTYHISTGQEQLLYENADNISSVAVSPDKKHILLECYQGGRVRGVIIDQEGKLVVDSTQHKELNDITLALYNAKWISNNELITPASGTGVCLINLDSTVTVISDIALMQTQTVQKVDDIIYFLSVERNLVAYDMNTKESKTLIDNVLEFELSPQKDVFAVVKNTGNAKALELMNPAGKILGVLKKANHIFGISWSPNQKKLTYFITSDKNGPIGLYIMNLANRESFFVSPEFINVDTQLKWNPSNNKLVASFTEYTNYNMVPIENMYTITLK